MLAGSYTDRQDAVRALIMSGSPDLNFMTGDDFDPSVRQWARAALDYLARPTPAGPPPFPLPARQHLLP